MTDFFTSIRTWLFPKSRPGGHDPEQLRQEFKQRYASFRTLLTANNNALQAMAELEKIYYGQESYRMADIRSRITTVLTNVYKMIFNLMAMAPGRYSALEKTFEKISGEIGAIVDSVPQYADGPLVYDLQDISGKNRDQVGGKMANLGEIAGLPALTVPPGFVMSASATRRFISPQLLTEINRLLQVLEPENMQSYYKGCEEIQRAVMNSPLPPELEEILMSGYGRLEEQSSAHCRVALRSSALGEDVVGVTFAGLYSSVLDVDRSSLTTAYKRVIASKYGPKAIAYRWQRGYRHHDIEMCVGCQLMVEAKTSGVTYSCSSDETHGEVIRINATTGIGRGVVDGTRAADRFLLERKAPHAVLQSSIRQGGSAPDGAEVSITLNNDQLRKLAESSLILERHFGSPQDIEWSFDQLGGLSILQSRSLPAPEKEQTERPAYQPESQAEVISRGGICASSGIACGEIHKIERPEQLQSFPRGAVLLVEYPLPEYAPLVGRAAAVIAEYGSEAGHLATVSREFGIPALFSVQGVMQKLGQGQLVTVDTRGQAIYRGRIEKLLGEKPVQRNPMAGSPVQRVLTQALQHITPLNLHDPASSRFKASWCETLHDITRFCHEKSVTEMFTLDHRNRVDKRTAKRLVGEVPLEWWVINLADGFAPGVSDESRTVRIEEITSVPMQAIWRGISAYPWEGPPPVSARGFGAIVFQSAMRPELDPAVASPLTARNYFLISNNFCNLSVRLGYHYAMIEAYLSDLLTESYVTFRFKGGAADMRRKAVRAGLLANILQTHGFQVELRSDALLARVKKRPPEYLEQRLQILGYLTLHARQLDMVMNHPQEVERYKQKFLQDIETLLNSNRSESNEVQQ